MARLPLPGNDDGVWGDILNEFLLVAHNEDGSLKAADTIAAKYTKPGSGIPKSDLALTVQASLEKADNAAAQSHNHDNRYYTESEIDTRLQYMVPIYILEANQDASDLPGTFPQTGGLVLRKRS